MTIISVGSNGYGHPDKKAIELYMKHSTGSDIGSKIVRTDENGNIRAVLKTGGGWSLTKDKTEKVKRINWI